MKIIPRDSKILSISHLDCDGVASQIVLGNIYTNITYTVCSSYKIDEQLQFMNENNYFDDYDYVFITDIHPTEEKYLDYSDKIILIDHHPSELHNPKKKRWVVSNINKCATVLVKAFVEKMYDLKLTHLNEFVKYINDYDVWELKFKKSKQLNDLMFYKMDADSFRSRFMNGVVDFSEKEQKFLDDLEDKFEKKYDEIEIYDFKTIKACLVFEDDFMNEIAHKLMDEEDYNIVVIKTPKKGRVSIRGNLESIDLGKILSDFKWGGGHPMASGIFVKSNKELTEKLEIFEKYLYDNHEEIRL